MNTCVVCGTGHQEDGCPVAREAAAAGAHPANVPVRVYGGYLEARAALRQNAPDVATRVLTWLLSHLAEQRGTPPERSFEQKMEKLRSDRIIALRHPELFEQAMQKGGNEQAWALMSVAEHALTQLYLRKS